MFTKGNVTRDEICWDLKTVEPKFSLRTCKGTNVLFREMFANSKIAHSFNLSRTKRNLYFEL